MIMSLLLLAEMYYTIPTDPDVHCHLGVHSTLCHQFFFALVTPPGPARCHQPPSGSGCCRYPAHRRCQRLSFFCHQPTPTGLVGLVQHTDLGGVSVAVLSRWTEMQRWCGLEVETVTWATCSLGSPISRHKELSFKLRTQHQRRLHGGILSHMPIE